MATDHTSGGIIRLLSPILLMGSMIAAAGLYLNAQYPNLLEDAQYQLFGSNPVKTLSSTSNTEQIRLQKIDALIISTANKIDLREGRPFWGAASHMVDLAFSAPADDVIIRSHGSRMYEFHRFGFSGNREPVVMEYAQNSLTCVHYPQREKTACSPGTKSLYAGHPFPFKYRVAVGN